MSSLSRSAYQLSPWLLSRRFTCTDVHAIYATGANNDPGGPDFNQFTETDLHGKVSAPVTYSAYALGIASGHGGFDYQPADSAALFIQGFVGFGP